MGVTQAEIQQRMQSRRDVPFEIFIGVGVEFSESLGKRPQLRQWVDHKDSQHCRTHAHRLRDERPDLGEQTLPFVDVRNVIVWLFNS